MSKLWIFGDSFSAPFSNDHSIEWATPYIDFKGYEPNVFGDIIAKNLNLKLENHARGGADNYYIFESICKYSDIISPNDLIIVGWSSPNRFRIIAELGNWKTIIPMDSSDYSKLLIHRDYSPNPLLEIKNWMKLLSKLYGDNIIFWSPAIKNDVDIYSPKDLGIIEHISQETKGVLTDSHYSENGHQTLSTILISIIHKQLKIKKYV
jgi:hypothetical protein